MSNQSSMPLQILVVEDSELDYELLLATFARAGMQVETIRVETDAAMRSALDRQPWDAIISDHNLPQFSSTAALAVLNQSGLDLPFIIVSGDIGEDVAVQAMREGADDYLIKGRLKRLPSALSNAIDAARNRQERRRAETSLARSEQQLRLLTQHLDAVKEAERARLAKQLHDRVGTDVTAAKLMLAHLRRQVESHTNGDATADTARDATVRHIFSEINTLLTNASQACSAITQELRPDLLNQELVDALEWLVRDFGKRNHMVARFESNRETITLDHDSQTAVFRFVEEALENVAKHAQASKVECVLFAAGETLTVEVSDNGKGMDRDALDRTGRFGLFEVRERVSALAGELDINSAPSSNPARQQGTTVMLSLPLSTSGVRA